jgi:hypothetical protein
MWINFFEKWGLSTLFGNWSKVVVQESATNVVQTITQTPPVKYELKYGQNWIPYNEKVIVAPVIEEEWENTQAATENTEQQNIQKINDDDYPIWLGI